MLEAPSWKRHASLPLPPGLTPLALGDALRSKGATLYEPLKAE